MKKIRLLSLLAAVSLAGCGGGGGVSLKPQPGNPTPASTSPSNTGNVAISEELTEERINQQFSGSIEYLSGSGELL
ncbi:MAG: hypothetical protein OXC81_02450, partial [Betaproteobacteria bacterium]|nr:hypothetical protein [Betaproteobacteria bacterium]